ncbi:diacylglycerol/lipid kinase family protein [Brevibacterium metallidurans]|uniref:DAGKc domain-containing protein n=1 Tax=Brevibacterium metallidurans TaxID=1482676 RepID=A0ABP3C5P1_9MICO
MRLGIIVNPLHARTHRAHHRLVTLLDAVHVRYRTVSTTATRTGARQAADLVEWGAKAVVVLGGDGTLRAAAPVLAEADVPVLIIPTGTGNVFSRAIGVHTVRAGLRLCEEFVHGAAGRAAVPVCTADCTDAEGVRRHEHFLSLSGIGGDAHAVAGHRRAWGLLGYARGAIGALFAPEHTVSIDGESLRVWAVMAAKTSRPAGPIPVFPGAEVTDEDIDFLAVVLGTDSPVARLRVWAGIGTACVRGCPEADPAMRYWTAPAATVTVDEPAPVHLDGDHLGEFTAIEVSTGELLLDVVTPPN